MHKINKREIYIVIKWDLFLEYKGGSLCAKKYAWHTHHSDRTKDKVNTNSTLYSTSFYDTQSQRI